MSDPFEKVRRYIECQSMLDEARGVVVAVSGGADSVALLDMLARLFQTSNLKSEISESPGLRIHVAHLDHLLRGAESAEDARFVRALAEALSLSVTVCGADVRRAATDSGRGIEEVAREIRYNFLLATAREAGCDRIATGHTMSDQAETFLMRLARGAGLRGLAAMRPVTPAHAFVIQGASDERGADSLIHPRNAQGNPPQLVAPNSSLTPHPLLVRPLLCLTREEVEAYCRERRLEYRTDATNMEMDYTRNRVRKNVLDSMRAINPRVVEAIARAAEIIAEDEDALDAVSRSLLERARLSESGASHAYSVRALLAEPQGARRRMILEAIKRARPSIDSGQGGRVRSSQVDFSHVAAVEGLLAEQASGSRVMLPQGLEAWREFDALVFKLADSGPGVASGDARYELEISGARPLVEAGGFHIAFKRDLPATSLESLIFEARRVGEHLGRNWMEVVLDDHALPERLVVRPRRAGERARVLGRLRRKKLKNLMIDSKIPSSRRATWPVVTTPDGRFVWSPGMPPAVDFAARDETSRLAILRASSI